MPTASHRCRDWSPSPRPACIRRSAPFPRARNRDPDPNARARTTDRCGRARSVPRRSRTACRNAGTAPARRADIRRRRCHHPTLDWLDDESSHVSSTELSSRRSRSPNGTSPQPGSSGPKSSFKNSSPDQRERPQCHSVEAALARHEARSPGSSARELHRRVHGLRAGVDKEHGVQPRRQLFGQLLREHPGQRRVMDLYAVDEARVQHRVEYFGTSALL